MSIEFIGSNKRLPVAEHLTNEEYKQLMETYAAHNKVMGLKSREMYSIANVVKVERSKTKTGVLEVYYKDGMWWHYTPSRSWY